MRLSILQLDISHEITYPYNEIIRRQKKEEVKRT